MKTILVDAFNTFVRKGEGVFQELYDLLETYPNRKIILTNANEEQKKTLGLVDLPYEMFTLKHNPDKSDPIYFEKMLEHFNLEKDHVIYFEHNEVAVKSAESVGITSYHYDHKEKDVNKLKMFLDASL